MEKYNENLNYKNALLDKLAKVSTSIKISSVNDTFDNLKKRTKKKYISANYVLNAINNSSLALRDIAKLDYENLYNIVLTEKEKQIFKLQEKKISSGSIQLRIQ